MGDPDIFGNLVFNRNIINNSIFKMNTGRTIQELIFYYDIDVNDPEYINKIDDLILRVISENQQKQTDEIFTLIRLQRYMIKKHYFLTKEGLKNE